MKKLFLLIMLASPLCLFAQDALPAPTPPVNTIDLQTVLTATIIYGLTWLSGRFEFLKGVLTTPFIRAIAISFVTAILSAFANSPDGFWHTAGELMIKSGPLAGWLYESIKYLKK